MGRLFFKLYNAGLNNCRMSLEIGVGLAHLTGRTLVPYSVDPPWSSDPILRAGIDYVKPATVLDLFDVPVPLERALSAEDRIEAPGLKRLLSFAVNESVLRMEPAEPMDEQDFLAFRNGRAYVDTLSVVRDSDADVIVDVLTLGMYSHFFYLGAALRSDLWRTLSRVLPRQPYRDLAGYIAQSLAPFNAVHIRLGDFRYAGLSPRSDQVSGDEVAANLASRLPTEQRLVVCTDSSWDENWFAPLRRKFRDVVFLDRLIVDCWWSSVRALPYSDDAVLGLLTQLIAASADCFVGTLYSSFTAMIQRARGFNHCRPEFLFCYSNWAPKLVPFERCEFVPVQDGPYSWNRILYPVDPSVTSWFREWAESFQDAPGPLAPGTIAAGTIVLDAPEARIHGLTARYERNHIGYWANPDDFVTWAFVVPQDMCCRVEIRYSCPPDCAGSAYAVDLDGCVAARELVEATGGWTMFSSWQAIGELDIRAGRHELAVRIVSMPGYAAMNLAGVRLLPLSAH